jgi:hypothetical protein
MKKIRLNLDSLRIDSFATGGEASRQGTVHGQQQATAYVCSWLPSCPNQPTCGAKTCAC